MRLIFFIVLTSSAGFCSQHDQQKPYSCVIKSDSKNFYRFYFNSVYQLIKSIIGSWLPSLIGIGLNITIIYFLRKASNERQAMSYSGSITLNDSTAINIKKMSLQTESKTCVKNIFQKRKYNILIRVRHQK